MCPASSYLPTLLPAFMTEEDFGELIMRDGASARLRVIRPDDKKKFLDFFQRLSPRTFQNHLFSSRLPSASLENLAQLSNPAEGITLIVLWGVEPHCKVIATASYIRTGPEKAEVVFVVEDVFQGKGLGSLLLERLALIAAVEGIETFAAVAKAENKAMLEVFRDSGFTVHERVAEGIDEIDLVVKPSEESVAQSGIRERIATVSSLCSFFKPRGVAVIGASRDPGRLGHQVFQALLRDGYRGKIYPVNAKAPEILGVQAYSSLTKVPDRVDLAVIVIPSAGVLSVVDEAAAKKVRALVVISAGFSETGPKGKSLQDQLLQKVRGYGMRMVGPNCMGLINTDPLIKLNASFSTVFPPPGRVAMSSQSGALGLAIVDLAARLGIGLTQFVSVGNKADVSNNDLLQYWEEDPQTSVILLYLESFGNPRKFSRIARRVARRKPIIVVKAGRTSAGQRAAGSHTAALASSEVAVEALFQQTGIIRADTLKEMFDLAKLLAHQPLPEGPRVAIVTNSGGPGILCTDACSAAGLDVLSISPEIQEKLRAFLPAEASVKNPIDMVASASSENYRKTIEILLTTQEVDAVVVIYIPVGEDRSEEIAQAVLAGRGTAMKQGVQKPLLMNFLAGNSETHVQDDRQTIPVYSYPEDAARALGKVYQYTRWLARDPGWVPDYADLQTARARRIIQTAKLERGGGWLSALETREVLQAFGIQMPPGGLAKTSNEAVSMAEETGYPLAVKLSSNKITHKTEMGGVVLDVKNEAELREAFHHIQKQVETSEFPDSMEGVLIQPMVKAGVEVIAGLSLDPSFGPLIGFGLGGIFVEILKDVQFRLAPLTDRDAREMIEGIRGFPLLQGYRGHPAGDVAALQELLLRFSALAELLPEIQEGDLNPIFALAPGQGYVIVDARLRMK